MKFELKTYKPDKKTVAKTYRSDRIKLHFGTVKGFLKIINPEKINLEDKEQLATILFLNWEKIIPLFSDIFPGITEEELDTVEIADMIGVVRSVFVYLTEEVNNLTGGEKN